MPLTARSGAFSARSGCSSARSNRSGGGGARYDEMDLYFKEFGLADGSSLPGQSLASLSSEADEEERRQKAGAERQDREAKLLKMKAQRSQVAAKLDEWAANFRKAHGRDPTDADRKRSAPQRELAKLKTDLDKYIGALDGTGGGGAGSAPDSDEDGIATAKRAERGRVLAAQGDALG